MKTTRRALRVGAVLLTMMFLGAVTGWAAFSGSTSNTGNSFSIAADIVAPTISTFRITDQSNCSSSTNRIRQGVAYYVCMSATDGGVPASGIASITADLSLLGAGSAVALTSAGGPWSGYTYRASVTTTPGMPTGTTKAWTARATDNVGNAATFSGQSGQTADIRSYQGKLLGQFSEGGEGNLEHYWRFNETSGTVADDAVTSGPIDGTFYNSPTLGQSPALIGTGGLEGTSVTFDGVNDYARVSTDGLGWTGLLGTYDRTLSIEFWFKSTQGLGGSSQTPENGAGLVDATNGSFLTQSIGTSLNGDGRVLSRAGAVTLASGTGFNDGKWHHVVMTMHAWAIFFVGGTEGKLYVDGQQRDSASTVTLLGSLRVPANFDVGRIASSGSNYLQGSVDEISTYSTQLSLATIQGHYGRGCGQPDGYVVLACGL